MIENLFIRLKEQQISIVNTSLPQNIEENKDNILANKEIDSFISKYEKHIIINAFVRSTIRPIMGYLIRRFFKPTYYFKDRAFFNYPIEYENKINLLNLLQTKKMQYDLNPQNITILTNNIKNSTIQNNDHKIIQIHDFEEKDFIPLRQIFSSNDKTLYLVFHIKNLHIFMMSKINDPNKNSKSIKRETYFCSKYSHRCLTPFYGFLKEQGKIIGYIYKYMSNGSLSSIIQSNNKISNLSILMIVNRLLQGINYLHSNTLIHRDLKPSNILFDNDFVPYISDFETIRHIIDEQNESIEKDYTYDLGTDIYSSPEQYQGKEISYSTDIYSFGLIIYFLLEKKNMLNNNITELYESKKPFFIPTMKYVSDVFNQIFYKCIEYQPKNRISIKGGVSLLKNFFFLMIELINLNKKLI